MSDRQLVFWDDDGHRSSFTMGDRDHLKFSTAFNAFIAQHVSEENTTFRLERVLTDEALVIETALGIVSRMREGEHAEVEYRRYERRTDASDLALRFAHSGFAALDNHGPWEIDHDSLLPDGRFENPELAWVHETRRLDQWRDQRRREIAAMPKLDQAALDEFCKMWADGGYNERISDSEEHYVFSRRSVQEAGPVRDELLKTAELLGLSIVATPDGATSGEVRVRSDPRVDSELEKWR
ncbi:DUF2398 domain-containing protein [Plantibacter sp. RU18]|uniref:DUF6357 family protein n=1 Tax=Plantibacter sp. TaxID=1871045 RepID=UPI003261B708